MTVINLSDEYGYNSEGYYCSLLAQARGHRVLPGVETLNKLESGAGIRMNRNLQQLCQQWIERNRITDETWQLNIYFGTCREKGLEKIARFIFDHYPCPILRVTMNNHARNQIESVQALSLRQLSESGQDDFANALDCFNKKVWRSPRSAKPARYNLAILYDPDEKFPPSDKDALNKFLEVARKMNIHAELITEEEATRLMEFDALFIRATTALNHYTFRLAQRAAMNDIAVKAAALIGKGLYGVDLKLINGRAVVIEINDNPSIDHEVEDAVLGDELYYRILNHFVHCLNRLHAQ